MCHYERTKLSDGVSRGDARRDSGVTPMPINGLKNVVNQLLDEEKAPQAVAEIIKQGPGALPHLRKLVLSDAPLVSRGWAIIATARIKSPKSRKFLEAWSGDTQLPELVRTWSWAGRIETAGDLEELQKLLSVTHSMPSVKKAWNKRAREILESSGTLNSNNLESVLKLAAANPQLRSVIAPVILKQPVEKLSSLMFTSQNNHIRRMAASYLGTIANQRGVGEVAPELARMYRYSTKRGRGSLERRRLVCSRHSMAAAICS